MTIFDYDKEERAEGWFFRFPSDSGSWKGPFPSDEAAQEAAFKAIEKEAARQVAEMLGLN